MAPKDKDWENKGILNTFNQREFLDLWNWNYSGLADFGYVFFPKQCIKDEAKCKVHVFLHGATTQYEFAGRSVVDNAGFNEYAVTNDLIALYPQTDVNFLFNPMAKWNPEEIDTRYG